MVTSVVLMAFVGLLAAAVMLLAPLGRATDEASQAENAADAAALAGAAGVRRVVLGSLPRLRFEDLDGLGRTAGCGVGRGNADDFATRNAARLTSYCYDAGSGRVEVKVQMRTTRIDGTPARAESAAALGLDFSSCRRLDDPPGTTTTPPPSTPVPAYPPGTELRCGGVALRFAVEPDGEVRLVPPGRLAALLVPRLVR